MVYWEWLLPLSPEKPSFRASETHSLVGETALGGGSMTTGRAGGMRKAPKRGHNTNPKRKRVSRSSPRNSLACASGLYQRQSLVGSHQQSWWFAKIQLELDPILRPRKSQLLIDKIEQRFAFTISIEVIAKQLDRCRDP